MTQKDSWLPVFQCRDATFVDVLAVFLRRDGFEVSSTCAAVPDEGPGETEHLTYQLLVPPSHVERAKEAMEVYLKDAEFIEGELSGESTSTAVHPWKRSGTYIKSVPPSTGPTE